MNILNRVNSKFKENKILYILVLIFFCIGIVLGTYTIKYMSSANITDLSGYFTEFINSLGDKPVNSQTLLFDIIKKNIIIIVLIVILGFTFFGTPIILLIDLFKGFTLGYTFSFLVTTFSGKGIYIGLASIIPQNLFYIPFFIGISIISIEMSSKRLKFKFSNKVGNKNIISKEVIIKMSILFCLFVIGVIVETFICPNLIKFIVEKVY